jgi:lipoate-protein ligase A
METYRKISACLVAGLRLLGVDATFEPKRQPVVSPRSQSVTSPCFSSSTQFEVTLEGRKLVGSAQRRIGRMLLQHGSLLIGPEHKRIVDLLPRGEGKTRERFARMLDSQTASLQEEMSRPVGFEEVAAALRDGFERTIGTQLVVEPLSAWETSEAERLAAEKYATDEWNYQDREEESQVIRRIV